MDANDRSKLKIYFKTYTIVLHDRLIVAHLITKFNDFYCNTYLTCPQQVHISAPPT